MNPVFYVIVFVYVGFGAVIGAKAKIINSLSVAPVDYGDFGNYFPPGSVKSIPCIYNNKFQRVEWVDPSGKVVSPLKTNRVFTQKHQAQTPHGGRSPSLLLTFTDAWVDDSGEYECRSDGLSETISLCIIDPLTFVDTPSEVSVDEGRSFTLTCEARGRPEPRLVWYRNEEVISDDCNSTKYKVMTKFNSQGFQGQLTITSIDPSDAGAYTCEAIQEHKDLVDCRVSKNWNMTLNVNYAPLFEDGNVTVLFAKVNKSVDLDCEPKAYPTPTFRWFSEIDDGTLTNYPQDNVTTSEDGTATKITVIANVLSFGMKYVCRATNSFGYASKSFTIIEIKKPKQPYEVTVFNYTDTRIEVNVTWEDEILFPIDEIQVQYLKRECKRPPREHEWKKAELDTFELADGVDKDDPSVKVFINDLEPETEYCVRLRAVNELGFSAWSSVIQAATAAEEEDEVPEELEDVETEPDTNQTKLEDAPSNAMFYGIVFIGGLFVVAVLFLVIGRLV